MSETSLEFSCTYSTCNSMNNLSSYCGLVDAKIRASDKDLPVHKQCKNHTNDYVFFYLSGNCLVSLRMAQLNIASKFRGQPFHLPIRGAVHLMGVAPLRGVALNPHPPIITIVKAKNMEPILTGSWQVSPFLRAHQPAAGASCIFRIGSHFFTKFGIISGMVAWSHDILRGP